MNFSSPSSNCISPFQLQSQHISRPKLLHVQGTSKLHWQSDNQPANDRTYTLAALLIRKFSSFTLTYSSSKGCFSLLPRTESVYAYLLNQYSTNNISKVFRPVDQIKKVVKNATLWATVLLNVISVKAVN